MVTENNIKEAIQQLQGSGKTFAEFLAEVFKDKFIEIYVGDNFEDLSTEQVSTPYPAVFCGKVVAAYRECLIISCVYIKNKHMILGNMFFVNERAIRALNEIDGNGIMEEMMLRSKESLSIKSVFIDKEKSSSDVKIKR